MSLYLRSLSGLSLIIVIPVYHSTIFGLYILWMRTRIELLTYNETKTNKIGWLIKQRLVVSANHIKVLIILFFKFNRQTSLSCKSVLWPHWQLWIRSKRLFCISYTMVSLTLMSCFVFIEFILISLFCNCLQY